MNIHTLINTCSTKLIPSDFSNPQYAISVNKINSYVVSVVKQALNGVTSDVRALKEVCKQIEAHLTYVPSNDIETKHLRTMKNRIEELSK